MILQTLKEVASDLRKRGIEVDSGIGDPISASELAGLEARSGISLPSELREFYQSAGDGVYLSWEAGDACGMFHLPPCSDLLEESQQFRANVADFANDPQSMDKCVDQEHRPRAFEIWRSMKSWLPFQQEANGDSFCIRSDDGHVVYNQHDWFDGFGNIATTNGMVAGTSLADFAGQWSRFYFTPPKSLWWGEFRARGRIDWDVSLFDSDFIR